MVKTKHCIGCRLQINETANTCPVCGKVQDKGKTGFGPTKGTTRDTGKTRSPKQLGQALAGWTLAVISGRAGAASGRHQQHIGRQDGPATGQSPSSRMDKMPE